MNPSGPSPLRRRLTSSRPDGWPLCPVCGEDELGDVAHLEADPENELFCYRCGFRGFVVVAHCDCRADDWVEGDEGAIRCQQCGGYAGEPGTSIRLVAVEGPSPARGMKPEEDGS